MSTLLKESHMFPFSLFFNTLRTWTNKLSSQFFIWEDFDAYAKVFTEVEIIVIVTGCFV